MPTISAKVIRKTRSKHGCSGYFHKGLITIPFGQSVVRMYGSAHAEEPKYVIYLCMDCAKKSTDKKVKKAIADYV